jgi:hypothetical protein
VPQSGEPERTSPSDEPSPDRRGEQSEADGYARCQRDVVAWLRERAEKLGSGYDAATALRVASLHIGQHNEHVGAAEKEGKAR